MWSHKLSEITLLQFLNAGVVIFSKNQGDPFHPNAGAFHCEYNDASYIYILNTRVHLTAVKYFQVFRTRVLFGSFTQSLYVWDE